MSDSKTQGIVAVPDNLIMLERTRLAEFAKDNKLPVISGWSEFAQSGGLMTYGPNSSKFFRRLADYVKKILAGVKPSEIPIEQPTTFELVINLRTAKSIGLTIPPTLLARADELSNDCGMSAIAQSGHWLVRCTCLLLTQSGHARCKRENPGRQGE